MRRHLCTRAGGPQGHCSGQANYSLREPSNLLLLPLRLLAPLAAAALKHPVLAPNYGRPVVAEDKAQFYLCEGITVPQVTRRARKRREEKRKEKEKKSVLLLVVLYSHLISSQGPNYILSKRMQQWRCIVARHAGHIVSFNVAPSTRTVSVIKNKQFAWAYDGMGYFPAVEVFEQVRDDAFSCLFDLIRRCIAGDEQPHHGRTAAGRH